MCPPPRPDPHARAGPEPVLDLTAYRAGMNAATPANQHLMRAALQAAARGFWVFPLGPGSKGPALRERNWQDLITRDPRVITRGWAQVPFNIGIACGPSGLHVLDLDNGRGETAPPEWAGARGGRDVLARLTAHHRVPYPQNTYRVATPSGGQHLYFTAPPELALRNSAGRLGWRIDTRGEGGYVVAAGSVLRDGRTYHLLDGRDPAPLPGWLATALTAPPPPRPVPVDLSALRADAYVHSALLRQSERITTAPNGQRHSVLVSAAASIGRLVGAGLLTRDQAHQVLRHAADHHVGIDGFTAAEAERTISDGLDFGIAHPRHIDRH